MDQSLLTRKRAILGKIETSYGVDSAPAAADAILAKNLSINPIQASTVSRDLVRPFLGNSEQLLVERSVQCDFEVEMVGSGTVGTPPGWDALIRACGFARNASAAAPQQVAFTVANNVGTIDYSGPAPAAVGDSLNFTNASDASADGGYNVTQVTSSQIKFSILVNDGNYTANYTVTPSGGSAPSGAIVYKPISGDFESISLYFNVDGVLHKLTGCQGTVEFSLAVKTIPSMKFTFTGLYVPPADVALPAVDFSKFKTPQVANTQNTPGFTLFGFSGFLESMNLNVANDISYVTLIGKESVQILDRKPAGTFLFEAPHIGTKDFFSIVSENTSGPMQIRHGSIDGLRVQIDCPSVTLGNPAYQDSNGVQMLSTPYTAQPTSAGNDEIAITLN